MSTSKHKGDDMIATMTQPAVAAPGLSVVVMREDLLSALAGAKPLANGRLPALKCVRLVTGDRELKVEATDLSTWAIFTLAKVQVEHQGELLVNCEKLSRCLAEMTGDTVTLSAGDNRLTVTSNDGPVNIATLPSKDMPAVRIEDAKDSVSLPANVLHNAISSTVFCAGDEGDKYGVVGLYLHREPRSLTCAATDGKRLSAFNVDVAKGAEWSAIMPPGAARMVENLLADKDDVVVAINDSRVQVTGDWYTVIATQLAATFPPYKEVAPKDLDKRITIDKAELLRVLRQASIVAEQDEFHTKIVLSAKKNSLTIRSGFGAESANVTLNCKYEGQEPIEIGMSARKFIEGIGHAPGEHVYIDLVAPNRAVVVTGDGSKAFTFVQMPININA